LIGKGSFADEIAAAPPKIVETFRPGQLASLGFDYEALVGVGGLQPRIGHRVERSIAMQLDLRHIGTMLSRMVSAVA
jgi:hypothetical protein